LILLFSVLRSQASFFALFIFLLPYFVII